MTKFPLGARVRNTLDDTLATVVKPETRPSKHCVACRYDDDDLTIFHTPVGNLELVEEERK